MLDVKVYDVQELVENAPILRVKQCLENVHEEFLVQRIEFKITLIQFVIEHIDR